MPVTKQAIKKVRQDKRKTVFNLRVKKTFKQTLHDLKKNPTAKGLSGAFSKLDRAAKTGVIHKNTASRLKSRLNKLVGKGAPAIKKEAPKKKTAVSKSSK